MGKNVGIWFRVKRGLFLGATVLLAVSLTNGIPVQAQEEEKKGFFKRLIGGEERKRRKAERKAAKEAAKRKAASDAKVDEEFSGESRTELIQELKAAKKELNQRQFKIEEELAAAKEELRRRQATGAITPEQVKLTPANIRDQQLSELEKLKAELARRRATSTTKQERIARALGANETAYKYVDLCITRPDGNFTNLFDGQPGLELVVSEKKTQVYRDAERTVLLQTTPESCDVSFSGDTIADYTAGLVHILETQGGLVETKKLAGLSIVNTVHPRGNFRLATGKKIIGSGDTNFYTTIVALR